MTPLSILSPAAARQGWWPRLLRTLGLEAWFRQAPQARFTGREERTFLLLTLTNAPVRSPEPLATALASCLPGIEASGGEVAQQQTNRVLLSWPAEDAAAALAAYEQLRACLVQQVGPMPCLYGAATLGWVTRRRDRYQGEVLQQVAGILHEGRQVGSPLLLSAALHQHLGATLGWPCELHVAFRLPGHRYPATLYRVAA